MKKNIFASYYEGLFETAHGEGYSRIVAYFLPEFVTNLIVYSMPLWLDAFFIAALQSTPMYATLGVTKNIVHVVIKVAEALSVSTVVLSGHFNGQQNYQKAGDALRDAFWVTCLIGMLFCTLLFFGGEIIFRWYGVQEDIIALGIPYLRIRAFAVLFMFIYFAFVGFLRGIKNTRSPMKIFIFGAAIFVLADYCLIFGKFGFPAMGLQGSAIATLLQYMLMSLVAFAYIVINPKNRKYGVDLLSIFTRENQIKRFCSVTWPMVLDKATLAVAYIWLGKMIAPMGTNAVAAFSAIMDMERFGFLPAIAFAQVVTLLVSNDFGAGNISAIKANVKKVILLSFGMIAILLFLLYWNAPTVLALFDKKGDFTELAILVFPAISVLVVFDLLQIILSGALRGVGSVRTVMWVRLIICGCFFMPISYVFSCLPFEMMWVKMVFIYGSFYISNALMSLCYIKKLRGQSWKTSLL